MGSISASKKPQHQTPELSVIPGVTLYLPSQNMDSDVNRTGDTQEADCMHTEPAFSQNNFKVKSPVPSKGQLCQQPSK